MPARCWTVRNALDFLVAPAAPARWRRCEQRPALPERLRAKAGLEQPLRPIFADRTFSVGFPRRFLSPCSAGATKSAPLAKKFARQRSEPIQWSPPGATDLKQRA